MGRWGESSLVLAARVSPTFFPIQHLCPVLSCLSLGWMGDSCAGIPRPWKPALLYLTATELLAAHLDARPPLSEQQRGP